MSAHGVTHLDTDSFRSHCQDWLGVNDDAVERCFAMADEVDRLRAEVEATGRDLNDAVDDAVHLRALLARAMRHIDPNGDQAALDLLRECEEAVG